MAKSGNRKNSGKPGSGQNGVTTQNFANGLTNGCNAKNTNEVSKEDEESNGTSVITESVTVSDGNETQQQTQSSQPVDHLQNPVFLMDQALDNKLRNLQKRQQKLHQLKSCIGAGNQLTPEQKDALSKLGEVDLQIEFVKEMQKLNQKQLKLYLRAVRKREFEEAANKLTTPSEQNDEDRSTPEEDGSSARGELKTDIECKEVTSNEETNDDSGW